MTAPDCIIINVRNPHGGDTYVARARTVRVSASSTMGRRVDVERCAAKIYGCDGFKLHQYTGETWLASPSGIGYPVGPLATGDTLAEVVAKWNARANAERHAPSGAR